MDTFDVKPFTHAILKQIKEAIEEFNKENPNYDVKPPQHVDFDIAVYDHRMQFTVPLESREKTK